MLALIGAAITLVVVFSGNEGGVAEAIVSTTEGTTTVLPPSPTQPDVTTASPPTTTTLSPETTPSPDQTPLSLEEIISGVFSPTSFNASWTSGIFDDAIHVI